MLKDIAGRIHSMTSVTADALTKVGYKIENEAVFHTIDHRRREDRP